MLLRSKSAAKSVFSQKCLLTYDVYDSYHTTIVHRWRNIMRERMPENLPPKRRLTEIAGGGAVVGDGTGRRSRSSAAWRRQQTQAWSRGEEGVRRMETYLCDALGAFVPFGIKKLKSHQKVPPS